MSSCCKDMRPRPFFTRNTDQFRRNACSTHALVPGRALQRRREQKGGVMRILATTAAALGVAGVIAVGTPAPVQAQGVYLEGPGVSFGIGDPYRYRHHRSYDRSYAYYGGPRYYGRDWSYDRRYYRHYRDWD